MFKSGFVTIIGRPNVGKSTIMNDIIGEKLSIVSNKPQTTRNKIQTILTKEEYQIVFIDTPGIHKPKHRLGEYMVKAAQDTLNDVDVVLLMTSPDGEVGSGDKYIIEQLRGIKTPVILVINKIDLEGKLDEDKVKEMLPAREIIKVSVKDEIDLAKVEDTIHNMFFGGQLEINNDTLITNVRHKNLLESSQKSLKQALSGAQEGLPVDCITIDLKSALESLAKITGEVASDDIIHEIFKQFCLGK
jgi:GTP-binding protein Era